MATEVSKNGSASCSKASAFSYANAVLNSKNKNTVEDEKPIPMDDKSNKENENVNIENINVQNTIEEKPSDIDLNNQTGEPNDDFIDYNGSKKKKKIAKMKKKDVIIKTNPNASRSPVKADRIREKKREKPVINGEESESNACDIKYVEAPVPTVNPWTIKRSVATAVKGENLTCSEARNTPDGKLFGY